MNKPLIVAQGLGVDYGLPGGDMVTVLNDVNCEIHECGRIALVGPSGSGKSTLLHCLGGLMWPTRGQIRWPALGARRDLLPRNIQFVFQAPSLYPALDVLRNVALPMVLAGGAIDAEGLAKKMLGRFGLSDLARKLPEELSGGQAQRVAMARALTISPRLVLADEPTGQLDSQTAADFLDLVFRITREAHTALIIATHDPEIARQMEQCWVIDHGNLSTQENMTEAET